MDVDHVLFSSQRNQFAKEKKLVDLSQILQRYYIPGKAFNPNILSL